MREGKSTDRLGVRVYGLLIRAYPENFRRVATDELIQVFSDEYEMVRGRWGHASVFWVRVLFDLAKTVTREHLQARLENRRAGRPSGERGQKISGRGEGMMGGIWADLFRDVRHGVRSLVRTPGFTGVAIVILALGIGANTTIFTVVNALFFEAPPHVLEPDRLVRLNRTQGERVRFGALAYPDYQHFQENNEVFDGLLAYDRSGIAVTIGLGESLTPGRGWYVSGNYFDVLGVRPAAGRWFTPEEDRTPGTHAVAVISYALWQTAFGGDTEALGSSMSLNGNRFAVVGVAPAGFRGASPLESPPDVWFPIHTQTILQPANGLVALRRIPGNTQVWLWGMGRLKEGVSPDVAQANMTALAQYLEESFAEWNLGWGVSLTENYRFHAPEGSSLATMTRLLAAVVAMVLLIASANVAILLLARGSARAKDVGIRVAIGAGRGRVLRQSLTESLLLALLGGALGVGMSYWTAGAVARLAPFSFAVAFQPDAWVLGFAVLLSAVTAGLFGLLPAYQTSRVDVNSVLKGTVKGATGSRARSTLVVSQVALSLMLVVAAGLFARSLSTASGVELGFEDENRALVTVSLDFHGYEADEGKAFIRRALERIRSIPGVHSAGTMTMTPFRGGWSTTLPVEGHINADGGNTADLGINSVSVGYFETMGIPLLLGRTFRDSDDGEAGRAVIVNEAVADEFWPGQNPLGRGFQGTDRRDAWSVIGVVADAQYYEFGEEPQRQIYASVLDRYQPSVTFLGSHDGDPGMARRIQDEILTIDPSLAITSSITMKDAVEREIGRFRVAATIVGFFGALALLLASVGLYGVLSYMVARQVREIGIRVALGASGGGEARRVVVRGLRLAGLGAVLGIAGSIAGTRLLTSFLYGVEPRDPVTMVGVPVALLVVAVFASLVPAWRATKVDPMEALRVE